MRNAACFDIGGTFIKYGVINESGDILFKNKFKTPKPDCRLKIPNETAKIVKEMQRDFEIDCIGISTAGQVDSKNGKIIFASDNLPDYTGTELSKDLKNFTGLDCYIENDVNAAALGELWKGSHRETDTFLFLTLGTGIGGAIIINGKLFKGAGGSAGEAGHIIINENGTECTCGSRGCYEKYASVSAFIKNYCRIAGLRENSVGGEFIMNRVREKEPAALRAYDEFIDHIVSGLVSLATFLDPGLIIIGGGITASSSNFIDDINTRFRKNVMPSYAAYTKIEASSLRNDAGLLGACFAVFNSKK
jgi:glucokinase